MKLVTILRVIDSWKHGGGVFRGITNEQKEHRFVATKAVMSRPPIEGEVWLVEGFISKHPKYGLQVEIDWAKLEKPSGRLIIHAIAKSKIFPGIGLARMAQLWQVFDEEIYNILDNEDEAPLVDHIGNDLAEIMVDGWKQMNAISEVFKWLDSKGIPVRLANDLMTVYPDKLTEHLEENPFKILAFTNWNKATMLANCLGIEEDCALRYFAAADAVNYRRVVDDHTWTRRDEFISCMGQLLNCTRETAFKAYDVALYDGAVMEIAGGVQGRGPGSMEADIASQVIDMINGRFEAPQMSYRVMPDDKFFISFFKMYHEKYNLDLNREQKDAVVLASSKPFGLITGGAGVGKTTVLHAVVEAAKLLNTEIHMIAFTGRAARRMEETSGHSASTIHLFCEKIDNGDIDLENGEPTIIIDESSMVDLATMYSVSIRMKPGCRLIMIGDPGQLPPIGFGVVFHTFCEYRKIPQVELTNIHRQASETGIPEIAKDIRFGIVPELQPYKGLGAGVSFIDCAYGDVAGILLDIVDDLGGFEKNQILSPLKRGKSGSQKINRLAHEIEAAGLPKYQGYAAGEPVIWLHNDYEIGLMNGSLGNVTEVIEKLNIEWNPEGNIAINDTADMDHAYCITVHKSQGSEFSRVVVPVFKSRLLDRTLLYTAITRSKHQVVLVGDRKALAEAVIAPGNANRRQTAMHNHLDRCALALI